MRKITQKEFEQMYEDNCKDFSNMDLSGLDIFDRLFERCNFSNSNLANTNIEECWFERCNFENVDFTNVDLTGVKFFVKFLKCNMTNAKGIPTQDEILGKYFEKTEDGYIVYKVFRLMYRSPEYWKIGGGSIIEEEVDMDRGDTCSYGINVATKRWIMGNPDYNGQPIWKCLLSYEDLDKICVPYGTDGKIRCGRLKLLEIIYD